jgi:hypothetical protein
MNQRPDKLRAVAVRFPETGMGKQSSIIATNRSNTCCRHCLVY